MSNADSGSRTTREGEQHLDDNLIKMLPQELQEEISEAEPEERIAIISRVISQIRYEGPLPPSFMLKEYEEILPGAADRILKMAEQQASHRQSIEKTVIDSKSKAEILGVIFAGLIGLSAIVGGFVLIYIGRSGEGIAAIITSLASLIGAYLYGTHSERAEREEKQKQRDGK